ncbi:hypothetical protein IQ07DRAFT_675549 [Pyrenochaeta sp. DS3sAY3a]|nr:hypothetical protein IQ07DRAFT_675549 [Pyrenochaeta sp. DS3sAY3a]
MSHLFHSQHPLLRISGSILSCLSTPYYFTHHTLTLTLPTLHSLFRPRPDPRTPAEIRFDAHRPRLWRRRAWTRSCSRCTRAAALVTAALQRAAQAEEEESEEAYRYSYSYTSDPFYWDAADPSNWSVLVRHDSLTSISEEDGGFWDCGGWDWRAWRGMGKIEACVSPSIQQSGHRYSTSINKAAQDLCRLL